MTKCTYCNANINPTIVCIATVYNGKILDIFHDIECYNLYFAIYNKNEVKKNE